MSRSLLNCITKVTTKKEEKNKEEKNKKNKGNDWEHG